MVQLYWGSDKSSILAYSLELYLRKCAAISNSWIGWWAWGMTRNDSGDGGYNDDGSSDNCGGRDNDSGGGSGGDGRDNDDKNNGNGCGDNDI